MTHVCCIAVLGGNFVIHALVERPSGASFASSARLRSDGADDADLRKSFEGCLLSPDACARNLRQNDVAEACHSCADLLWDDQKRCSTPKKADNLPKSEYPRAPPIIGNESLRYDPPNGFPL